MALYKLSNLSHLSLSPYKIREVDELISKIPSNSRFLPFYDTE